MAPFLLDGFIWKLRNLLFPDIAGNQSAFVPIA